ncbi:hypothetical protein Hanom_Chr10g00879701 [Helianthus anomalus]
MEGTEVSVGNNGNKESSQTIHFENNANMGDPKNYGEAVSGDNGNDVNFGVSFLEINSSGSERKSSNNKRNNRLKKGRRVKVGHVQDKMISVDTRPSSRKRPRLEVDPNGLDPFGLDALLGLYNHKSQKVPNEVTSLSKESTHTSGSEDQGSKIDNQGGFNGVDQEYFHHTGNGVADSEPRAMISEIGYDQAFDKHKAVNSEEFHAQVDQAQAGKLSGGSVG